MNYSTAIFLVNPSVRCITVAYDKSVGRDGKVVPSEIKSFKSLDPGIAKNDFVVVPTDTRWGYTVGRVEEVDVRVNYSSTEQMRWIVARVDKAFVESLIEQEKTVLDRVAQAQEKSLRDELAAKLMASGPDLSGLSIVDMRLDVPPPPAPRPPEHSGRGGAQRRAADTFGPDVNPGLGSPEDDDIPF